MKSLLLVLALAAPASAQSIFPNSAGSQYCQLRSFGVPHRQALRAALSENQSAAPEVIVPTPAGDVPTWAIQMVVYINRVCPQHSRDFLKGTDV